MFNQVTRIVAAHKNVRSWKKLDLASILVLTNDLEDSFMGSEVFVANINDRFVGNGVIWVCKFDESWFGDISGS